MADSDAPPTKKKSRFFSDGKSKIGNLPTNIQSATDNNDQSNAVVVDNSDSDELSQIAALRKQIALLDAMRKEVAASDNVVDIDPYGRDQPSDLPNSQTRKDDLQSSSQTSSEGLATRNRKREAVYGAYNTGLGSSDMSASSSQTTSFSSDAFSSTSNLIPPPGLSINQIRLSMIDVSEPCPLQGSFSSSFRCSQDSSQSSSASAQIKDHVNTLRNSFDPFASVSVRDDLLNSAPSSGLGRSHKPQGLPRIPNINAAGLSQNGRLQPNQDSRVNTSTSAPHLISLPLRGELAQPASRRTIIEPVTQRNHPSTINSGFPKTHPATHFSQSQPTFNSKSGPMDEYNTSPLGQHPNRALLENAVLDTDRDMDGALLPIASRYGAQAYVRQFAPKEPAVPANHFTSPKRTSNAIAAAEAMLKRKKPGDVLSPPPAYVYVRSNDPNFNIFTNGFLLYPELCFVLAQNLQLRDLIGLYAISKDFHTIIDRRFTTVCLTQALRKAPESAQTFQFRMYAQHCRRDPAARIPHPDPVKAAQGFARMIPSFRWVAFVLHREKVVHELITVFAERGVPLPARCGLALKRIWVIMDIPDNARRIALIHNHRRFTDIDLHFLMCFVVKLDLIAHDPAAEEKADGFRKILLTQPGGLDTILKVLKREMWIKKADFLVAWVKTMMNLDNIPEALLDEMNADSVFGVPRDQVGLVKYEYWGREGSVDSRTRSKRPYLLRPDQLVMREAIRRGMRFEKHFLRYVLYGYVRPDTLESYAPRSYGRRIAEWNGDDYDAIESLGGFRALSIEDGGDELLDLGDTNRGSEHTIKKEPVSMEEREYRADQRRKLEALYKISKAERDRGIRY